MHTNLSYVHVYPVCYGRKFWNKKEVQASFRANTVCVLLPLYVQYLTRITYIFPQTCRIGFLQVAARQYTDRLQICTTVRT